MSRKLWVSILFVGVASIAAAVPRGTVPKPAVSHYRAYEERNGVGFGATLLTSDQVHKAFAADVSHCCFVVEVAFYPKQDSPLDLSLDDLTMRVTANDLVVRPYSPRAVAATLQQKDDQGHRV